MMPGTHPTPEMLMDYASGAAGEGASLVIATHLALCPDCRSEVDRLECLGGALLEADCGMLPVSPQCREQLLLRLDDSPPDTSAGTGNGTSFCRILPAPLRGYVGCNAEQIHWEKFGKSLQRVRIDECGRDDAQLLRISAGAPMPRHTHRGLEYTLVLRGSFRDESGLYRRGDIAVCDGSVTHAPVAGPGEDCICLVVTTGPLRLSGLLGRLISPFMRF